MSNYHLALAYFITNECDASLEMCQNVLAIDKNYGYAHLLKSYVNFKKCFYEKVDKNFDKIIKSQKQKTKFHIKNLLFSAISKLYLNQNYQRGLELVENCKSIVNVSNDSSLFEEMERIVYCKCILLFKKNETNENVFNMILNCVRDDLPFNKSDTQNFKISNFAYLIGFMHLKLNNDDEAEKYLERALELDDKNPHYYTALFFRLIRQEKYDEASILVIKAIEKCSSKNHIFHYYYSYCLIFKNDLEKAGEQLRVLTPIGFSNAKMVENFVKNDLKYECRTTKLKYEIDKSIAELEVDSILLHKDKFKKLKLSLLEIEGILNFSIYFKFYNLNFSLFKAFIEFQRKNYLHVIHFLEEAQKLNDYNLGVKCLLGLAYLHQNKVKQANNQLRPVLDLKFTNVDYKRYYLDYATKYILAHENFILSKFCLALISFHLKQIEKAKNYFIESLDGELEATEINYIFEMLFRILHRSNRLKELKRYIEKAKEFNAKIENKELGVKINIYEGVLHYHDKYYDKAILCIDEVMKSYGEGSLSKFYKAIAIKRTPNGSVEHAQLHIEDLIKKHKEKDSVVPDFINADGDEEDIPVSESELYFHLAECFFLLKEEKNCEEALQNVKFIEGELMLTFTIDDYYYYQGINAFKNQNYKKVIEMFNNIREENFNIVDYSQYIDVNIVGYYKAISYFKLNDPENSHNCLKTKCNINKISNVNRTEFYEYKLYSLFDVIILLRQQDKQEKLNIYMEEFKRADEEIDQNETQLAKPFLVQKYYYKILLEYEIKKNYKNCLDLAVNAKKSFENEKLFSYFIGLNQFKLGVESMKISENEAKNYLTQSKKTFEKYIENQEDKTKRLLNSYFVLGMIDQIEAEYEIENEEEKMKKYFHAADYFKKTISSMNILNNKIENDRGHKFELNEYNEKSVRFHHAESIFKIKEIKQAESEFTTLYQEFINERDNESKSGKSYSFKHYFDGISIFHGINCYLGIIKYEKLEPKLKEIETRDGDSEDYAEFASDFEKINLHLNDAVLESRYEILSKFYLSKCLFYNKDYEAAYEFFNNNNVRHLGKNFENEKNQLMVKIYFNIGLKKYKAGIKNESEKFMRNSIEKCEIVIGHLKDLNNRRILDKYEKYLLLSTFKINIYSFYYLNQFEKIKNLIEIYKLIQDYSSVTDFIYYYAITFYKLYEKERVEIKEVKMNTSIQMSKLVKPVFTFDKTMLEISYEYFLKFLIALTKIWEEDYYFKKEKDSKDLLLHNKDELQKYLTAKYYLAQILKLSPYEKFEESTRYFIQILKHDEYINEEILNHNIQVTNIFKNSKIEEIIKTAFENLNEVDKNFFKDYREFDLNDLLYSLTQNLFQLDCHPVNFEKANLLLNEIKFSASGKNFINSDDVFYSLGFSMFKLNRFNEAFALLKKCKFDSLSIQNHIDYLIGNCLVKITPVTNENLIIASERFSFLKNNTELVIDELNEILIETNYNIACNFRIDGEYVRWQNSYLSTIEVCDYVIKIKTNTDESNSINKYYFHACKRKYLSLYFLEKYEEFRESFKEIKLKFLSSDLFIYLNILVNFKIIQKISSKHDENKKSCINELLLDCEKYLKLNLIVENKRKLANVKYIQGYILLKELGNQSIEKAALKLEDSNMDFKSNYEFVSLEDKFLSELIEQFDIKFHIIEAYFNLYQYQKVIEYSEEMKNSLSNDERVIDISFMWAVSRIESKLYDVHNEIELKNISKNKNYNKYFFESKIYLGKNYFHLKKYDDAFLEINKAIEIDREKIKGEIEVIYIISNYRLGLKLFKEKLFNFGKSRFSDITLWKFSEIKNDNRIKLTWMFYKAWSLFFLRNFQDLEVHLNEIIDEHKKKELSIENFYDFYFLLAVCFIENSRIKTDNKIDNSKFEEAKKYLFDYLSGNERNFNEQDPVTLTDEIYSYDIDDMKNQKFLASTYYIGLINLYFRQYDEAEKRFIEIFQKIFEINNLDSLCEIESLQNIIDKYFMFKVTDLFANLIEVLDENYKEDNNNQKNKVSSKFIQDLCDINLNLKFFDNNLQDCVSFHKAKKMCNDYIYRNKIDEFDSNEDKNFLKDLETISKKSRYYAQARIYLAIYYFYEKNFHAVKKYLSQAEKSEFMLNDYHKNNIIKLKVNILVKKFEIDQQLEDHERKKLLLLTDESQNQSMPAEDLEKFLLINLETRFNFALDNELEDLENIIRNASAMHENNLEFLYLRAKITFKRNKFEESEKCLDEYISKSDIQGKIKATKFKIKINETDKNETSRNKLIQEYNSLKELSSNKLEQYKIEYKISKTFFEKFDHKESLNHLKPIYEFLHENLKGKDEIILDNINYMIGICKINDLSNKHEQHFDALEYFIKIKNPQFKNKTMVNYCIRSLYFRTDKYSECLEISDSDANQNSFLKTNNIIYKFASKFWINFDNNEKLKELYKQINETVINTNPVILFYKALIYYEINEFDRFLMTPNANVENLIDQAQKRFKTSNEIESIVQTEYRHIQYLKYENFDQIHFMNGFACFIKKQFEKAVKKFCDYEREYSKNDTSRTINQFYKLLAFNSLIEQTKSAARSMTILNREIDFLIKSYYDSLENLKQNLENIENNYPRKIKFYYIANIYYHLNDYYNANICFEKFLNYSNLLKSIIRYDTGSLKLKISLCLFELDKYDACFNILVQIKDSALKEYVAYNKAKIYLKKKEFKEAMESINEAIEIGKNNNFENLNYSYFYKGVIYFQQRNYKYALEAFNKQIEIQQDYGPSYVYKAYCYENFRELKPKLSNKEILELYDRGLSNNQNYEWFDKRNKRYKKFEASESQIYISFSEKDKFIVQQIYDLFSKLGFNVCIIFDKIENNDQFNSSEETMKTSKILIPMLSKSYAESEICSKEINFAYENKIFILPIVVEHVKINENEAKTTWLGEINNILNLDDSSYANLIQIDIIQKNVLKHPKLSQLINTITKKILDENSKLKVIIKEQLQ
jgi:tetratricopeptide (TPR) repeat protein